MRRVGTGSIFYARSSGLWIGQREVPMVRGKRKVTRVSSKTFCAMLEKFSSLGPLPERSARPRYQNLARARRAGTHTVAQWYAQIDTQNGLCYYCGQEPPESVPGRAPGVLVKDHKIPIARGGSDSIENVVGACEPCNREKATRTAYEYLEYRHAG